MAAHIIEEKSPVGRSPPPNVFDITVEIDRESRDQIKLSAEIRQRLVRPNRPDPPLDLEEIEQLSEERELVDVQTQTGVAEMLEDEKKEAAAATQIEHGERRRVMQFQVLRPHDVETQPSFYVGVFRVVRIRGGLRRLDLGQTRLVDLRVKRRERDRMNGTLGPAPGPAIGQRLRELRDFVGKPHVSGSQMKMPQRASAKGRSGRPLRGNRREDGTPNVKNRYARERAFLPAAPLAAVATSAAAAATAVTATTAAAAPATAAVA